jgi:hypothetical protein
MSEQPTYIQLTKDFRVSRADNLNFEVEEFKKAGKSEGKGRARKEDGWASIGFYSDLSQAVTCVLKAHEKLISVKDRMNLENIVVELKSISENLKKSVRESGIKVEHFTKVPDARGQAGKEVKVSKSNNPSDQPKKRGRGRPRKTQ